MNMGEGKQNKLPDAVTCSVASIYDKIFGGAV